MAEPDLSTLQARCAALEASLLEMMEAVGAPWSEDRRYHDSEIERWERAKALVGEPKP
jgi:hypothetical protein